MTDRALRYFNAHHMASASVLRTLLCPSALPKFAARKELNCCIVCIAYRNSRIPNYNRTYTKVDKLIYFLHFSFCGTPLATSPLRHFATHKITQHRHVHNIYFDRNFLFRWTRQRPHFTILETLYRKSLVRDLPHPSCICITFDLCRRRRCRRRRRTQCGKCSEHNGRRQAQHATTLKQKCIPF